MKNIKLYIIFLILTAGFYNSCSKESLDIDPIKETSATFFTDTIRMEQGVRAVYAGLTDLYSFNGGNSLAELYLEPDDAFTRFGGDSYEQWKGITPGDGKVTTLYRLLNRIVYRANTMLDVINSHGDLYPKDSLVKKIHSAECLFLRAFAYYKLWHNFGKAPLITHYISDLTDPDVYPKPSSGFQMLDQAIADLTKAAELMGNKVSWDMANKGRITANSANGLLVKLYVLRACYSSPVNKDGDYQKAIAAFNKIDQSATTINGVPYGNNFDVKYENNIESLFEFCAGDAPSGDNPFLDNDFGGNIGRQGSSFYYFSPAYDGWAWGFNPFLPTKKLINKFNPLDPRFEECMGAIPNDAAYKNKYGVDISWYGFKYTTGYVFHKYILPNKIAFGRSWTHSTTLQNARIIRFADVKLAVAEAYLETGDAASALAQVNDVRTRARKSVAAGQPESAEPANLSTVNRKAIMDERMVELCGEDDHRWVDLKRWHKAGWVDLSTWSKTDDGTDNTWGTEQDPANFTFDASKNLLYPIPSEEISRNINIGGQNPGY